MTYTHANLEVSESAYEEIRAKLLEADYRHAIDEKEHCIDMHGIALVKEQSGLPKTVWVMSLISNRTQKPRVEIKIGAVRTQVDADAALDIAKNIIEVCSGSYADAFIYHFLSEQLKQSPEVCGQIIQQFREYREQLAEEFKGAHNET